VFLIIMSQKLPNKNDLAIQNKEITNIVKRNLILIMKDLQSKSYRKPHNQCNLFKKTKKKSIAPPSPIVQYKHYVDFIFPFSVNYIQV